MSARVHRAAVRRAAPAAAAEGDAAQRHCADATSASRQHSTRRPPHRPGTAHGATAPGGARHHGTTAPARGPHDAPRLALNAILSPCPAVMGAGHSRSGQKKPRRRVKLPYEYSIPKQIQITTLRRRGIQPLEEIWYHHVRFHEMVHFRKRPLGRKIFKRPPSSPDGSAGAPAGTC